MAAPDAKPIAKPRASQRDDLDKKDGMYRFY
jgi:hypothetical protein